MAIRAFISLIVVVLLPANARAWPESAYPEIFKNSQKVVPAALAQMLQDFRHVVAEPCRPVPLEESVRTAIRELSRKGGDLRKGVEAMRNAGCAAVNLNDPRMDETVRSMSSRFAPVFYGFHALVREGKLDAFLKLRLEERRRLDERLRRFSTLPNKSGEAELSPEYGIASLAFSHAVTDVANVWFHIWRSANGSLN